VGILNLPEGNNGEKRVCGRTNFLRHMVVKLNDGKQIKGSTTDVSLGGVSLDAATIPDQITAGQCGQLHILLEDGKESPGFNCTIVRISDNSIGIKLDKKTAPKFGILLTKNLFKRK